jgi:hypothetical protein
MALAFKALPAVLALGGFSALATALPAQAQTDCGFGVFTASVLNTSFSCVAGDKIYSNFTSLAGTNALPENFRFSIIDAAPQHTISTLGTFSGGAAIGGGGVAKTYGIGYRVSIAPGEPRVISSFTTDFTLTEGLNNIKTLQAILPPAGTATAIRTNGTAPSVPVAITPGATSVDFISQMVVSATTVQVTGWNDTLFQTDANVVPGPLPILGAGIAFGYSRKLRSRIKALS